jgi:L-aspartate oxidase
MKKTYDIVVVGSGIGGLSTILYLAETSLFKQGNLSICLISKGSLSETNTNWAQGGIAAVNAIGDNFDKHIQDTLNAGAYTNNKYIVEKVVKAGPQLLTDLISWGTHFDKNTTGGYDLAKEGGHSDARIWHKEDQTGKAIQDALILSLSRLSNVTILEHTCVVNTNKYADDSFGLKLYGSYNQSFVHIFCSKLVLATGGLGMLYQKSTNQPLATGDGIYLASKLGATIENLSLIQFHPTGLYENGQISFLISEALRGAGAILRNEQGNAFMYKYDERLDLAPRDIVSRAIVKEIGLQQNPFVYLDATQISTEILETHFPAIKQECLNRIGLNIKQAFIPIIPVQHYSCGGIKVDEFGETSISGLFAIGETASTGLHGANRLASNSLLEAVAFAKFSIPKLTETIDSNTIQELDIELPILNDINKSDVQEIMSKYAGIVKSNQGLNDAYEQLSKIKNSAIKTSNFSIEHFEANCILYAALLLIHDAQLQSSNKGVFYNSDLV